MNTPYEVLLQRINRACRRWKQQVWLQGLAKVVLTAVAAFLVAFALDSAFDLPHLVRYVLLGFIVVATLFVAFQALVRPLSHAPTPRQIARYVEEKHRDLDDRLVTAVELGASRSLRFSPEMLEQLLLDARLRVEPIDLRRTIRNTGAVIWSALAFVGTVVLLGLVLNNLEWFASKSSRIFAPWTIPKITLVPTLEVTPGSVRLARGTSQEIVAKASAFQPETVTLYFTTDDSTWRKLEMDPTPEPGTYALPFLDLQQDTRYYVKADDRLSDIYTITVFDAPKITRVDLTYEYPAYTGLPTKNERDSGDIWAPEGTVVHIRAVSDKPLTQAEITLGGKRTVRTRVVSDTVVVAKIQVSGDTYYRVGVTDTDGLSNEPPPEYFIHALPDQPPNVTVERPGRDLKATMLEEVPVKIRVGDDFGLQSLKLVYTVNGNRSHSVDLYPQWQRSRKPASLEQGQEATAEHLFYLEDLKLQPGDFLTYYVETADRNGPITSDIFFIDIRPFEQEFTRPMSQGQRGGGANLGGKLSQTQKDIIIATWKLLNRGQAPESVRFKESLQVIQESQANLKKVTENTLFQMQQRAVFSGKSAEEIGQYYQAAIEAMQQALTKLGEADLKAALTFERRSYLNLLKAEAQITAVQVQRAQASGAVNTAALEELAELFENEFDKLKNKYETERQQTQQQDQAVDEVLQKVKELARRQQQLNNQLRDLAREPLSAAEKKRRLQELRREQEKLRRQAQQLARHAQQMQNQNRNLPRDVQDSLRRATSEMTRASNNLRRDNPDLAAAKGRQALNRLQQLQRRLERNQNESLRKQLHTLQDQFEQLAREQKKLTEELARLNRNAPDAGDTQREKREQLQQRQRSLRQEFSEAKRQMNEVAGQAGRSRNRASRELRKFSRDLDRSRIQQKMQEAERLVEKQRLNSALQAGRDIQALLNKKAEELARLRTKLAESPEEKLDVALDETRKLREGLETAQKEVQELQREQPAGEPGQEPSQQAQRQRQAGPGETRRPPQNLDPRQLDWFNERLAESLQDLDFIQQSVQMDSSLRQQAQQLSENVRDLMRTFTGGDPQRFQIIEERILFPLKTFEAELAQKLELVKNKEKLFLARDEKIPPEYRDLVEKYYEALSDRK